MLDLYMAPGVEEYLLQLVLATRDPDALRPEDLTDWLRYGASPRAPAWPSTAAPVPTPGLPVVTT